MPSMSGSFNILLVDDEEKGAMVLERPLVKQGYRTRKALSGQDALNIVGTDSVDLILLDVVMPGLSGFEVCRILKQDPRYQLIPIILITGQHRVEDRIKGIEMGADDFLNKPVDLIEMMARVRSLLRVKTLTDQLDSAEEVIFSLARAVEARDAYTGNHVDRVATVASSIGMKMGLSAEQVKALKRGGILHDIGKIGIPDYIINKKGRLTPEEFEIVKTHPVIGYKICEPLKSMKGLLGLFLHHHERLDGSGYPHGLKGDEIPVAVRIISVADIYDSLTSDRSYRARMSLEQAFYILDREAALNHIDGEVVDALKAIHADNFEESHALPWSRPAREQKVCAGNRAREI